LTRIRVTIRSRLVSRHAETQQPLSQRAHAAALRRRGTEEQGVRIPGAGCEHVGGYDEWTVDITDVAAQEIKVNKGSVRIAVWCDNSRDLEMIPSSLSDFNLYGGLYRLRESGLRPGDFAGARAHRE